MIRSRLLTYLPCLALLPAALAVPAGAQSTASVDVAEDTYLKQGSANKNQGGEGFLRLRSSGKNRALLRFDEATLASALGGGSVTQATLVLTISDNGNNWGSSGRTIDLHRMAQAWTELGATWNCPNDTNTGNSSPDGTQWDMGGGGPFVFAPSATASALITNNQSGEVSFDVTADVLGFLDGSQANFGWILKKTQEGQNGRVEFSSREGGVKARLDLTYVSNTATSLVLVSGDGQTGTASDPLAQPFVVEARDASGAPLQGVAVTFTVTAGGGSLSNLQAQSTGADGRAQTTLSLGPAFGANTVTATATGLPALSFSASATSRRVEVTLDADSYLKQGSANKNQGAETVLTLRSSGKNRALLRVDTVGIATAVGSSQLLGATLELSIASNANNWGTSGRTVDLHRVLTAWTELGATWKCPDDTNTANSSPDGAQWDMSAGTPFVATPLVTTTIANGQTGVVSLDVTTEVQAYLAGTQTNAGWILKKTEEGQNGRVDFHSREASPAPKLVLLLGATGADTTPPVLPPLSDLVVEQGDATGAVVNYTLPPATDDTDPTPVTSCTPPPGSLFAPGVTTVTCVATDASGNQSAPSTFTITVQDTIAPTLAQPADLVVEQQGPAGSVAVYSSPPATDAADPAPVTSCTPPSGSLFPAGVTTVTCFAVDAAGNQSAPVTFTITVQDTTAPALPQPADLVIEQESPAGSVVAYATPSATDAADPAPVTSCTPPSGSLFPAGVTTVTCFATDAVGNQSAPVTFTVTVLDSIAPTMPQPPDLGVEQQSPSGAVVNYTLPSATDAADPAPVTSCTPPPGSVFPPGVSVVTCFATDASGNQSAPVTFQVSVGDTIPPVVTQPADLVVEQASPAGTIVSYPPPAVFDASDPAPVVSCTPSSGSLFSPGANTVTCVATDVAGNLSAPVTFTITVQDTIAPSLSQPADLVAEQTGPQGAVVTYAAPAATDAADPAPSVSCTPPSGSVFPAGSSLVSCVATDAAGNQSVPVTFTVTVQDTTAPTLAVDPPHNSTVSTSQVPLSATYSDTGSGIDVASFQATLDGQDVTSSFTVSPSGAQALSPALLDGTHTLVVTIADLAGNPTSVSSSFDVDTGANAPYALELSLSPSSPGAVPVLTPNDLTIRAVTAGGQTATGFSGFVLIRASDGLAPLDGLVVEVVPADQGQLTLPGIAFFQTLGTVVVTAASLEAAPNDASGSLPVNVVLGTPVIYPTPPPTLGSDRVLPVEGLSYPSQPVDLLVDGQVVGTTNAGPTGAFTFSTVLTPGTHSIFVRATDSGSGTPTSSQTVTVTAPPPAPVALSAQPAVLDLNLDQIAALTITESFVDGTTADVTALAGYSSSNPALVNVIGPGEVLALGPGQVTLTVSYDGLSVDVPVTVGVAALIDSSPAPGESEVAVTRETILRFSAPLDVASVSTASVFAEFAGAPLPARQHLAPDRKTLTLFYDPPLPSSSRVRVVVDGDQLLTGGSPIDADRDGVAGGVGEFDFDTLSLSVVNGTAVCGRVFASEVLSVSGGGSINVPLEGVRITVDGAEDTLFAVTDQNGDFRLEPAPSGRFFVHIDGRTATVNVPPGAYYPFVGKPYTGVSEEETNVGEIYLPLVKPGSLQAVSETSDTSITFAPDVLTQYPELQGLQLTVPQDSLYANDGTRGGQVGIAPVPPDRLPGPLPPGLAFSIVITVQTDGATNFDVPAPVRYPNIEGLPPGTRTALWSFNHDVGAWEVVGGMTVSADGLWVETDPGVGILAPGWHGVQAGGTLNGGPVGFFGGIFGFFAGIFGGGDPDNPGGGPGEGEGGPEGCEDPNLCPDTDGEEGQEREQENPQDDEDGDDYCGQPAGGSVSLHSGEERIDRVDLWIPGRAGLDFVMRRRYRSQITFNGPLGHQWDFDYNERLFVDDNDNLVRNNGRSHVDTWHKLPGGFYAPPAGFFGTLRKFDNGTFVLRALDGSKKFYMNNGLLYCLQDRHGNEIQFQYDGRGNLALVIDTYGREIEFFFEQFPDGRDRLVKIRDFIGREVVYTYSPEYDLCEVRSPVVVGTSTGNDFPNGRTERYGYSSGSVYDVLNHNLTVIFRPEEVANGGPPHKQILYGENIVDTATFDKVIEYHEGGINASGVEAGGTVTIQYEALNQGLPPDPDLPRGKATVTERNGNVAEYFVNEQNSHILTRRYTRGLRPGEPVYYEVQSFFNQDGLLVRRIFPEGNEIRHTYGTGSRGLQRKVVQTRMIADSARGGGEDLVTTFTFEPLYLQLASMTDPRGNSVSFVPPLGTTSPARYETTQFFDYQEHSDPVEEADFYGIDISGIPRGLGDLNGDGRTDQAQGNVVRKQLPSVELRPTSIQANLIGTTTQEAFVELQWNDVGQPIAQIDSEGNVTEYDYYPESDPDGDGQRVFAKFTTPTEDPTGYLRSTIQDARVSPRRSYSGPLAQLETTLRYDPVGNVTAVVDPRGIETRMEVTALNETVVSTHGASVVEALVRGELITGELPYAYSVRTYYDHNARAVRTEVENRDSTTAGVGPYVDSTTTYDILDNPVQTTVEVDASKTLVWTMRYDEEELLQQETQPEGNSTFTVYDERNLAFRETRGFGSPNPSTTQVNYDRNGNQVELIDAEDNDGNGSPEASTLIYDGFDRVIETVDALGNRVLTTYDVGSNPVRRQTYGHPANAPGATAVLLNDMVTSFDELRRVYQTDLALFVSAGFAPQRAVQLLDGNSDGFVTTYTEYDRLARITHVVEDDGEVATQVYDGLSRQIETIDAVG